MNYCIYYQARVARSECWYVTSILRSSEHLAFDRTLDAQNSIFEFYVSQGREQEFLFLMKYFQDINLVDNLQKLPNRLLCPDEQL
jgi:hypothetical protein